MGKKDETPTFCILLQRGFNILSAFSDIILVSNQKQHKMNKANDGNYPIFFLNLINVDYANCLIKKTDLQVVREAIRKTNDTGRFY